jgi:hypothetical protein
MPLPEAGVIQQGELLDQIRNPGFETENLPSPKGFDAPSVAPIPIPGTGGTIDGTGRYSGDVQSYINGVLGKKDGLTPGKLPSFSVSDVYNPRYTSILPGEDSEEVFAQAQPWYKQWGNAMVKMGATAAGTFVNTLTAIPDTISSIRNGTPWDTAAGGAIDTWLKNLEDTFPNYYTKWQQEHPFMSALPFSGGFSNFWGDKFLKNLGFTIGAIGGAVAQDMAIGALTGGLGEIPLVGAQIGKASLWLNKVLTGTDKVEDLLQLGRAAGRTTDQLMDLKRLSQAAAASKVTDGARFALNLYGSAASEAGFEARDGYNNVRQDLITAFQRENGYSPTGKELDEIDKYARSAGNTRFGINLALLGVSNAIQFDNILKPFSAAKAGLKGSLQKEIEDGAGTIALKQGSIDTFERVVPKTIGGKLWNQVRPIVPSVLSEGVYEEGGQYAAQVGTENYYERKYIYDKGLSNNQYKADKTPWDAQSQVDNVLHSMIRGMAAEFGTTEGLENVFLGALTGAITGGVGRFIEREKSAQTRTAVLKLLNDNGVTGTFRNNYDNTVRAHRIAADMQEAVQSGDLFKYKNYQHEQFTNFVLSGIKAGRFDVRMEQLKLLKDMPDDQFKVAFGLDKTTENVKTVSEYVEKLTQSAQSIKKSWDMIDKTFVNPYKYNRKAASPEASVENEKHHFFESWKSELTYLSSILPDADRRLYSITREVSDLSQYVTNDQLRTLTDPKELKAFSKTIREQATTLQEGVDGNLSADKAADRKKIDSLIKKADRIDSALADTEYSPEKYKQLFEDLLNYNINGQSDEQRVTVPKQAIPALMNYGVDINRLQRFKESANKAFDILSSEEGFNKYFRDIERGQEQSAQKPPPSASASGGTTPSGTPPPAPAAPVKPPIVITHNNEQRIYDQDKDYFVQLEQGKELETVQVIGQSGNMVEIRLPDGTTKSVPAEVFFREDTFDEEITKDVDENTSRFDVPLPPEPDGSEPPTKRGDQKKDLSFGLYSTTDPTYDNRTTPFNLYQRRHQNFLFNLGSSNPEHFNQENRQKLKIIPVTAKTAALFGFPAEFTQGPFNTADNAVIRAVYVIDDKENGMFFTNEKGEKLGKIGELVDPTVAIFTTFASTDLTYGREGAREERYTNKQNLDETQAQTWWRNQRQQMLDITTVDATPVFQFMVSRGTPNIINWDNKNNVLEVGLIQENDLDKPIITIATQGNVAVMGAYNDQGQGISAAKEGVNMPVGTPLLNHGGNLVFLNSKFLSADEASNIYEILKIIGSRTTTVDKAPLFKYLNKVVYLANRKKKITPTKESLTIDGSNLYLGLAAEPINTSPASMEQAKDRIIEFLTGIHHAVNNSELLRIQHNPRANDLQFNELQVQDGAVSIKQTWKNYNHYLLSNKNPDDKRRVGQPLTTNIAIPQEGEVPIIQKYAVLRGMEFDSSVGQKAAPAQQPAPAPKPVVEQKNKQQGVNQLEVQTSASVEDIEKRRQEELFRNFGDIESYNKIKDLLDKPVTVEIADEIYNRFNKGRDRVALSLDNGTIESDGDGIFAIYNKGTDRYNNVFRVNLATKKVDYQGSRNKMSEPTPLGKPYLPKTLITGSHKYLHSLLPSIWGSKQSALFEEINAKYDAEIAALGTKPAEKKAETPKQQEAPLSWIELDLGAGPIKLGFKNVIRDAGGNITDLEAVGKIDAEGKVTPFKDPTVVKGIILDAIRESQIKEDSTNTKDDDFWEDPDLAKGTDPQYREFSPAYVSYKKGELDKEFQQARRMLGDDQLLKKVQHVLKMTGGGFAYGAFADGTIYVWEGAKVGTTHHEVFEKVYNTFLDGREQQELYDEFIQRKGSFKTPSGKEVRFSDATVKEAKEQIAEEFTDFILSKKLPDHQKQRSFFQRLWDFIKKIIFGDPGNINSLFKKINKGYYRNFSGSQTFVEPQYREVELENFSQALIQDTMQGMTVEMLMEAFKEGGDIITQLEENEGQSAKTVYDKLKTNLEHYFENKKDSNTLAAEMKAKHDRLSKDDDKQAVKDQYRTIVTEWQRIKDNWDSFVRMHQRYLRVFNIEFEVDDEGNIDFAEDDEPDENKNMSEYDRDILKIDAKNSASAKIKLLIATLADSEWVKEAARQSIGATRTGDIQIKRENSLLALPKQVQYAKLFNYLLHNTTGINGIYDIWEKLKQMTVDPETRKVIDANIQRLMNRIEFNQGFQGKNLNQVKLILSLENTLSKQKLGFSRQFVDFQRNTYYKTTVLNSKIDQVKATWIAGIKGSGAIIGTGDTNFRFSKTVLEPADNIGFLNKIGIPITRKEYERLRGSDITDFNREVNVVRSLVEKAARENTVIPVVTSKQLDFNDRLNTLAEIYITKLVGDDTQSQHPNLDNEQTTNFVLGNFASTMLNDANLSATREEFVNKVDNGYLKDIFHQDSLLLNDIIFDPQSGQFRQKVQLEIVEGRESWNGNNKAAHKLTEAERQLYELNNNLNGVFYTLLPADAKMEWAVKTGTYLSAQNFFGEDSSNEVTRFANIMYGWLQTEVNLAKDYENRKDVEALNGKLGDRLKGNSLRFFNDILPKAIVDEIHKKVVDGNTPLAEVITQTEMRQLMREYAFAQAEKTFDNLLDWKLISVFTNGTEFRLNGFDRGFLDNYLGKKQMYTRAEVLKLIGFREMNYILNNIEMHKFFFGDPAQYKDELKRIKSFLSGREVSHVDYLGTAEGFNQWANSHLNEVSNIQLQPTDPGYHQHKNHLNTITVYDVDYESDVIDQIKEVIGEDKAGPYTKGNEADAQAWISPTAYREVGWKAGGRFTAAQERQFQWEMAWERNDKAKQGKYTYSSTELQKADNELLKTPPDADVAFQPFKLIHSGIQTKNDVAIASLDKASWAPLFYRWVKGTALEKMYDTMQNQGVDYIRMESAHKVGIQRSSAARLYNEDGDFNQAEISKLQTEPVSFKHLGVQVEQRKKDKGQTEGSQARKMVTLDLVDNTVPVDFLKEYSNQKDAITAWNGLSEDQKKQQSAIYAKIKRHDAAIEKLVEARLSNTMHRLGIVNGPDGNPRIEDKQKVSDFILSELERRELPRNLAFGLEIDPKTGDFSQPLEANAQYSKIRSILYSVIEDTIMRPKVNGGQKTMVSVTGWEKAKRIVKRTVNGKPVYTSGTLKFYTRNDAGTEACEVMLPYWFGKKLTEMGSGRTKEEVLKYLNSTQEGQKLLRGIGFRIPTQGMNSIDFFVVKDFLPEQMGDVVILPSEITAKAGSDFDIDKLNTYLRNFYVDNQTGYPRLVQWKGSPQATKEYIGKLLDEGNIISKKEREELDRIIEEETEGLDEQNLLMRIPGIMNLFSEEQITRDFLGKYRDQLINKLYTQALENELFDSIEQLLSLPENYQRLISPNDASQLKGERDKIRELKGETAKEGKLGNYGKLLDSTFMVKERQAYMASKGLVAVAAVAGTFHSLSQRISGGLILNAPISARFPHNMLGDRISFSGVYSASSRNPISNIISQTVDGGVDVAKDKFLAEMGITSETAKNFLTYVRAGSGEKWAIRFLNQPAIQEYVKLKAIHDSVSQVNPQVIKLPNYKLVAMVQAKFGGMDRKKERIANKPTRYTIESMEHGIKKWAETGQLTREEQTLQLMMLDDYLTWDSVGWDMFHYYQGFNWDTARLGDPNAIRLKQLKLLKASNLSISSAEKMLQHTFIGPMYEATEKLDEGLRSAINVQKGAADQLLNRFAGDLFVQKGLGEQIRRSLLLQFELSMVDFAVQTTAEVAGKSINNFIHPLLIGDKAVAKYVKALQSAEVKRIADNPFIKNLQWNIDSRMGYPSLISLQQRDYDTYTSNVWTDAFREMKNDNAIISINKNEEDNRSVAQIYKNLVLAAILENGSKRGSNSISHLIPNESFGEFTRDSLRNLHLEGFYENNVVYRTNWNNNYLVPNVEMERLDPKDPDSPFIFPFLRTPGVVEAMKEKLQTDKPPLLLNLPAWKYSSNKAVKIVNMKRDENTKQVINMDVFLFVRVDVDTTDGSEPLAVSKKRILFKQINAWGDGSNIQEYYVHGRPSVLPNNVKVNEIEDEDLFDALIKGGLVPNVPEGYTLTPPAEGDNKDNDDNEDMDDEGDIEPGPKDPLPTQPAVPAGEPDRGKKFVDPVRLERIKNGSQTIDDIVGVLDNGVYTAPDGTKLEYKLISNGAVYGDHIAFTNGENMSLEIFAQKSGFNSWEDYKNNTKFADNFIAGKQRRNIFSVSVFGSPKPVIPTATPKVNNDQIQEDLKKAADLYLKDWLEKNPRYYWPIPRNLWDKEPTREEEDRYLSVPGTRITLDNLKDAMEQDKAVGDQIGDRQDSKKSAVAGILDPWDDYVVIPVSSSQDIEFSGFNKILDAYTREKDPEDKAAVEKFLKKYSLGKYLGNQGDIINNNPDQLSLFQLDKFETFKNTLRRRNCD